MHSHALTYAQTNSDTRSHAQTHSHALTCTPSPQILLRQGLHTTAAKGSHAGELTAPSVVAELTAPSAVAELTAPSAVVDRVPYIFIDLFLPLCSLGTQLPLVHPITTCPPNHHLFTQSPLVHPITTCSPNHHFFTRPQPVHPTTTSSPDHHLFTQPPFLHPTTRDGRSVQRGWRI
jgi:hypothetical protein